MKLFLLKPCRLLFGWVCCFVCLYKMWTAFSGSCPMAQHIFLSWPKPRTWFCVHKVLLPSIPLQSVETPVMVFLFPCLTLPYVSYAEFPNDITKITLCAVIFGAQCEAPVTGVPSGGLCCWWIDPSCSQAALTGSHQYMSYIWVTVPSVCCAALPFPPPTASILKHHWTSHQGCESSWQPHFLGVFSVFVLLAQEELCSLSLTQLCPRTSPDWGSWSRWGLRCSGTSASPQPEPQLTSSQPSAPQGTSLALSAGGGWRGPVHCWQHLCLCGRGFAQAVVSSSSAASLGSPAMSTPGSEPLLVLTWLGFFRMDLHFPSHLHSKQTMPFL